MHKFSKKQVSHLNKFSFYNLGPFLTLIISHSKYSYMITIKGLYCSVLSLFLLIIFIFQLPKSGKPALNSQSLNQNRQDHNILFCKILPLDWTTNYLQGNPRIPLHPLERY